MPLNLKRVVQFCLAWPLLAQSRSVTDNSLIDYYGDSSSVCLANMLPNSDSYTTPFKNELYTFYRKIRKVTRSKTACTVCKSSLEVFKQVTQVDTNLVYGLLEKICLSKRQHRRLAIFNQFCQNLNHYSPDSGKTDKFSFLPDFINMLQGISPMGIEGQYLCHYIFSKACPVPKTPTLDYTSFWPAKSDVGKPKSHRKKPNRKARNHSKFMSKRKTFKVLHVSDVHLSMNYAENTPANCLDVLCCRPGSFHNPIMPYVSSPKYGYWSCDTPPDLLQSASNSFSKHNYSFALFTGDMVDHNPILITRSETMEEERLTMDAFKRYLGKTPVYPVLGNHDSFPYSQEPSPNSTFFNRTNSNIDFLADMWTEYKWINKKSAKQLRENHGGYSTEPMRGLKVISINSNYWYRWNFYNYLDVNNPMKNPIFQYLIDELIDCEKRGLKAWVQAHVPPGGVPDEALPPQANLLVAIFERFGEVISGYFFGHTHHDEFTIIYANSGNVRSENDALGVLNVGPSITPFTDLNPGWRYYEVDSETFEIMDIVTYYADIEPGFDQSWSDTPELEWKSLYSARKAYESVANWPSTEPLNGKFWHRVASKFLGSYELTNNYLRKSYRMSSRTPQCKNAACLAQVYCYSTSMTPDQAISCINEYYIHSKTLNGIPKFPMPIPGRHIDIEE